MKRVKKNPLLSSCSLSILTRFRRFLLNKKYVFLLKGRKRKTCTQRKIPREGKICQGTIVSFTFFMLKSALVVGCVHEECHEDFEKVFNTEIASLTIQNKSFLKW